MRQAIPLTTIVAVLVLNGIPQAPAQSAYDYPWCAISTAEEEPGGAQACYYATYEQCRATMEGIGGYCIRSPYYRGALPRAERRHRRI